MRGQPATTAAQRKGGGRKRQPQRTDESSAQLFNESPPRTTEWPAEGPGGFRMRPLLKMFNKTGKLTIKQEPLQTLERQSQDVLLLI